MLSLQPCTVGGLSRAIRSAIHPREDRTGTGTRMGLAAGEPEGEGWGVRPLCGVCFLANFVVKFLANPRSSRRTRTPHPVVLTKCASGC